MRRLIVFRGSGFFKHQVLEGLDIENRCRKQLGRVLWPTPTHELQGELSEAVRKSGTVTLATQ